MAAAAIKVAGPPLSAFVPSPAAVTAPPSNQIEQPDKPFCSLCVLLRK